MKLETGRARVVEIVDAFRVRRRPLWAGPLDKALAPSSAGFLKGYQRVL